MSQDVRGFCCQACGPFSKSQIKTNGFQPAPRVPMCIVMPTRSRSHVLEEESVSRLRELLPANWVVRSKNPDYGIDLEIEIFAEDGRSTGLMFFAQLRATDDSARADVVRLEVDELEYYAQLDLPVAILRYCSVSRSFYWQWDELIAHKSSPKPRQVSMSYRFQERELWHDQTSAEIQRTLEVRRAIAAYPAGAALPVRLNLDGLPSDGRYAVEREVSEAIALSNGALRRARGEIQLVEVLVAPEPHFLSVRIDSLTSATFDLPEANADTIVTSALYGIVRMLARKQLTRQASAVARLILARGRPHHHDGLAFVACQALAADLPAFVELAIINGFHLQQNVQYGPTLFTLARAPQDETTRNLATDNFFAAASAAARDRGPEQESAVQYSMANFYRNKSHFLKAVMHFNRARRLRPAYLRTGYFLRELGGVLFLSRRYASAVRAYQAATELEENPRVSFLLGDALFMAGRIQEALQYFENAAERSPAGPLMQEIELKSLTCQWLLTAGLGPTLPRRAHEAERAMRADGEDTPQELEHIVEKLDGLNPRARFNLGVRSARNGDDTAALHHFLLCAFTPAVDETAWSNAAICALRLGISELVIAILSVGIRAIGVGLYDRLRADLLYQGAPAELVGELDTVVSQLLAEAEEQQSREDFTIRVLQGDEFETLTLTGDPAV